jgi:hypothetical protein
MLGVDVALRGKHWSPTIRESIRGQARHVEALTELGQILNGHAKVFGICGICR